MRTDFGYEGSRAVFVPQAHQVLCAMFQLGFREWNDEYENIVRQLITIHQALDATRFEEAVQEMKAAAQANPGGKPK